MWRYTGDDLNGNGALEFEEQMHRSTSTVVIRDGLLLVADLSGILHCLDARTGKAHWTHDLLASVWGSPLVVDGKIYVADADGNVTVFEHSTTKRKIAARNLEEPVYTTPIVANNVMYIATMKRLLAITSDPPPGARPRTDHVAGPPESVGASR